MLNVTSQEMITTFAAHLPTNPTALLYPLRCNGLKPNCIVVRTVLCCYTAFPLSKVLTAAKLPKLTFLTKFAQRF